MSKLLVVMLVFLTFYFTGCGQIAYKKYGDGTYGSKVGYSDFEIGKNKYKVTYTGGVNEDRNRIIKFAYKRAKELCEEKGFKGYKVSNTESTANDAGSTITHGKYQSFNDTKSQKVYMLDVTCE